jgi:replicative DNA helicase
MSQGENPNIVGSGTTQLPGSVQKQGAILGWLIIKPDFFIQAHRRIQSDWFVDWRHSTIYKLLCKLYKEMGSVPNVQELSAYSGFVAEGVDKQHKLLAELLVCTRSCEVYRLEALKDELGAWLHSKILADSIKRATKEWNSQNWEKTAGILEDAVKAFADTQFEEGIEVTFSDHQAFIESVVNGTAEALTTGLPLLDRALLDRKENQGNGEATGLPVNIAQERCTTKGLQLGDTTVILAPSNTGKTTSLLTIARHNIWNGKSVLLMTHEGRPEDIKLKLMQSMLNRTSDEIHQLYQSAEGRQRISNVMAALDRYCTYIPFNKAGMTVEDAAVVVRRKQEERASKNGGKGYDLLVVDYPGKLTTDQASRNQLSYRHIQDIVYEYYVQLALEYKFHSLVAIQSNREGSRINSGHNDRGHGPSENRLLGMEDVAEAWGPMTSASNVITLNRSPAAKTRERITYYVAKSRSSATGAAVVAQSNFRTSLTHHPRWRSTLYYGTHTMEEHVDTLLDQHNGQALSQADAIRLSKGDS